MLIHGMSKKQVRELAKLYVHPLLGYGTIPAWLYHLMETAQREE